ncbi:MAG: PorP/SprF family type IX secretion system membrane protein [Saprospiraceae bacterium]|nr:PorP/SprF family type IX secretion system membrane protein [Saprospiraceae bacterium]
MQQLKHTLCLLIFFWQCIPSEAQQLPYQTQFRQLYAYINPASISSDYFLYEYNTTINASYRLQWAAQPQTPRTFYVGGEYIHNRNQNGAGFNLAGGAMLLRDRVGPLSLTGVSARIASLFAEDPYFGAFSVGFSFGMTQYRLLHDRIVWETLDDPTIPLNDISTTRPEIGAGVYYFKRIKRGRLSGDNFYAGASVPQLWAAHVSVESGGNNVPITRIPHFYVTSGWYHFFNEESFLEVGMWGKLAPGARPNVHLTGRFQPLRTFWVGAGFNPNGLVHLETGFNLPGFMAENGNLKIGYAFDYNISAFDLPLGSSHELHVSYLLDTR